MKDKCRVSRACIFCQRSHMTCDPGRPCKRCIHRRISHLCHDGQSTTNTPPSPTPTFSQQTKEAVELEECPLPVDFVENEALKIGFLDCEHLGIRMAQFCREYNFGIESRQRVESVISSVKQVATFIREHLSVEDVSRSNEYTFHSIMEFNRIIMATSTPFVLTRGTGEIVRANDSFSRMVKVPLQLLCRGDFRLCQFFTEEAFVNYCEKVVAMYFNQKQKALITNCEFVQGGRKPFMDNQVMELNVSQQKVVSCSICATVRRDMFNLPILVAITVIPVTNLRNKSVYS